MNYIINSLLTTDLYKLNMAQLIFSKHADITTTWEYKCRNADVKFTKEDAAEISHQLDHLCTLHFTTEEIKYIEKTLYWLKPGLINFLKLLRLDRTMIHVDWAETYPNHMRIWAEGPELITSHFEIPVLTIVSEVYFRNHYKHTYEKLEAEAIRRFDEKLAMLKTGKYKLGNFSEFGLRRRFNGKVQEYICEKLAEAQAKGELGMYTNYLGTSNVYLAMKTGVKPIGTMAHEIIEIVGQGDPSRNPAYSNRIMMDEWQDEFKGLNGIYLTDCIKTDLMLMDLTRNDARLWDGYRQDSGDPIEWGEKMITKLSELGVDPKTKTLLWSDSLNFEKATALFEHFNDRCKVGFGIGTYITNDTSVPALNQVMKVVKVNGNHVAKVSDSSGKGMCQSEEYVNYLNRCLDYRLKNKL